LIPFAQIFIYLFIGIITKFEGDAKKTVSAAIKAKAWTFEAKTTHPKAKAIKLWPQGASRPRPGLETTSLTAH